MPNRSSLYLLVLLFVALAPACQQTTAPPSGAAGAGAQSRPRVATSVDKIAAAENVGKIDHDTALVYRVFALFTPEKLPRELVGARPSGGEGTTELGQVAQRRDAMRPDLQAAVQPFFARPTDPTSFWAPHASAPAPRAEGDDQHESKAKTTTAGIWSTLDTDDGHMRLWYVTKSGSAQADALKASLESESAWGTEKAVMGREPCSDLSVTGAGTDGLPLNGSLESGDPGAGRLDIYIVTPTDNVSRFTRGKTRALGSGIAGKTITQGYCPGATAHESISFLVVSQGENADDLASTTAHELFHAFQNAFPNPLAAPWFGEASATWAEDIVYPKANKEQWYLQSALCTNDAPPPDDDNNPVPDPCGQSLWQSTTASVGPPKIRAYQRQEGGGPLDSYGTSGYEEYSSYIFPFFLTRVLGKDSSWMRAVWENLGNVSKGGDPALKSLRDALGDSGFRDDMKQFALVNWNADVDEAKKYQDWAGGALKPMGPDKIAQYAVPTPDPIAKPDPQNDQPFSIRLDLFEASVVYKEILVSDLSPTGGSQFVPQLSFDLSGLASFPGLSLQAILYNADPMVAPQYQDWTGAGEEHFCRDQPAQKIGRIVLIAANADPVKPVSGTMKVTAKAGCNNTKGNFTYAASTTVQHGQLESCVKQRKQIDDGMTIGGSVHKSTVTGSVTYTESVSSQWTLVLFQDITNPVTKERTVLFDIHSVNKISLSGSGSFDDQLYTKIVTPDGKVLGEATQDANTQFSLNASGTSCNGPPPPTPGSQGSPCPGFSPPPGRTGGRDGQVGALTVRLPQGGKATYQIAWGTAGVPLQSTCSIQTKGLDGKTTSQRYVPGANEMINVGTDGRSTTHPLNTKPLAVSGDRMSDADSAKFWHGDFPASGDIHVQGRATRSSCSDPGNIGMYAPPCDFQLGDNCDICSGSSQVTLNFHVDIPPAAPPAPPPSLPPGTDACTTLAACCPGLAALPMGAGAASGCTALSGMGNQGACANMLSTLKGKNLCP